MNRSRYAGSAVVSTPDITLVFTLPTSVTIASGASRRISETRPGNSGIGVQTKTSVAPATLSSRVAEGMSPERSAARASASGSASNPRTLSPARTEAIAIEVPISPVPTTATRSAEVIAQRLRAVEVHVRDLGGLARRVELQEDPDHTTHRPLDGDLLRAEKGDAAETHPSRRLCREGRAQVLGDREERGHDVVGGHVVALEHLGKQALRRGEHRVGRILVDVDRPARRSNPDFPQRLHLTDAGERLQAELTHGHERLQRRRSETGGAEERPGFLRFELADVAGSQPAQADRPDANADQTSHRELDGVEHLTDLALASLDHHETDPSSSRGAFRRA